MPPPGTGLSGVSGGVICNSVVISLTSDRWRAESWSGFYKVLYVLAEELSGGYKELNSLT